MHGRQLSFGFNVWVHVGHGCKETKYYCQKLEVRGSWTLIHMEFLIVINSPPGIPGVTLCFYRFVHRRHRRTESCSSDNFWTTFWISFISGTIVGPKLYITWLDFGRFSSLPWPWIFKVKYWIGYISAKMVRLPRNKKQTHCLNSRPLMWTSDLTSAVTLTLNFQGQIWNLFYLNQKWSDCHKTKSKHIDLNYRSQMWQWVWPWPWLWYLNFLGHIWSWPFGDQGQV